MAQDDTKQPEANATDPGKFDELAPEVWDRFGAYFNYAGAVTLALTNRNVRTWNEVSTHLRNGKSYTADTMASDSALLAVTVLDNLQDLWKLWTAPPEGRTLASAVPTALLVFAEIGAGHSVVNPVFIVPPADVDPLPRAVRIVLDGERATPPSRTSARRSASPSKGTAASTSWRAREPPRG